MISSSGKRPAPLCQTGCTCIMAGNPAETGRRLSHSHCLCKPDWALSFPCTSRCCRFRSLLRSVRLAGNSFKERLAFKPVFPGLPALFPETGRAFQPVFRQRRARSGERSKGSYDPARRFATGETALPETEKWLLRFSETALPCCGCPPQKVVQAAIFRFSERKTDRTLFRQTACRPGKRPIPSKTIR